MNKKESNKVNSFHATEEVMNQNQTIWSKSAKIAALFALIAGKLKLVSVYDKKKNVIQPSSVLKKGQKATLIELAIKISKSAIDYAVGKNDAVLEFRVKVTKSKLSHLKENTLITVLQKLYETVIPFRNELVHLAKTDIDDFKTHLDAFVNALAKPQAEMDQSKTATNNLSSLITEINDMFITLDKHMGPLEYTFHDFYSDYKNSRVNKDLKKISKTTAAAKKANKGTKAD